jgi:branched-chain amino acid transport system permease protein
MMLQDILERVRERAVPAGVDVLGRSPRRIWAGRAVAIAVVAIAVLAPLGLNGFQLFILSLALCYAVATIGFNIALGWAGLFIFTGSAFFGLGAFLNGRLSLLGLPAELTLLLAAVIGGTIALAFGAITVRLNNYYFAISGIAFMFVLDFFYRNFSELTGGYSGFGIPAPEFLLLGGRPLFSQSGMYYVGLVLVALAYVVARWLERTPLGRGWRTVRKDERIAAALGIHVWWSKLWAFTIASTLMALAGGWFGFLSLRFLPETFMFRELIFLFLIVIVGGLGSVRGMIVGSLVLVLLREYLRGFPGLSELIYGVALLAVVLFFAKGIYGAVASRWRTVREGAL